MNLARSFALAWVPLSVVASACGGASSSSGSDCSLDPACYVVTSVGECTLDMGAVCVAGAWQCSSKGTLGSGCLPDGGIAPPPPPLQDGGACPLATLQPPLACNDDATCAPYDGHCEFSGLDGPGECVCGEPQDSGIGPDGCAGAACYPVCTLPSFTVACSGPGDPTCSQYGAAYCAATPAAGYACECEVVDPPHDACPLDCTAICPPGVVGADCVIEPDGGFGCDCAYGGVPAGL